MHIATYCNGGHVLLSIYFYTYFLNGLIEFDFSACKCPQCDLCSTLIWTSVYPPPTKRSHVCLVSWLVLSTLLAGVTVLAKQSSDRVELLEVKWVTKRWHTAPGGGPQPTLFLTGPTPSSWLWGKCRPPHPRSYLPTSTDGMGWQHPAAPHTWQQTLCLIYAFWSCWWEKLHCCFHGKGIINTGIRLTNCKADNLLKEIFHSVDMNGAKCGIYQMSHNCGHLQSASQGESVCCHTHKSCQCWWDVSWLIDHLIHKNYFTAIEWICINYYWSSFSLAFLLRIISQTEVFSLFLLSIRIFELRC